ncbi:zinc-finger domain-containing protein [Rickettsiales endosymbiont of Stachyamoeba lipophora]|uniref:zinc-finger domain-containing protein n=1 Tax=Rickettsiales endosymbiont of Stachyamoeba lipophora TaxID=2486578 RepID=UPI000F655D05|nr:zinc-finger domain-containing protein [Rickettsiales endosymbiont of Stachyamoeba lipophora]AZL16218.1 zinc-finger domain-containing protein [Rickettsiales endosymbiont of Stachyamoeba lipophora]
MFKEEQVKNTTSKEIWCEGEDEAIGHPKIYLEIGETNEINCPYCSMKFIYTADPY